MFVFNPAYFGCRIQYLINPLQHLIKTLQPTVRPSLHKKAFHLELLEYQFWLSTRCQSWSTIIIIIHGDHIPKRGHIHSYASSLLC